MTKPVVTTINQKLYCIVIILFLYKTLIHANFCETIRKSELTETQHTSLYNKSNTTNNISLNFNKKNYHKRYSMVYHSYINLTPLILYLIVQSWGFYLFLIVWFSFAQF